MKKVLIIGHFWPYRGGSARMLRLAKYLPSFGWEPIIITGPLERKPDFNIRYEEINYPCFFGLRSQKDIGDQLKEKSGIFPSAIKHYFLKPIYNFIREIIAYPDEHKYWEKAAIKKAAEIIENEEINAIISIWPVTSHTIANKLKEKYKIPWIADFPDLWTQNYYYIYGRIRKFFEKRLEIKTLLSADALVTVSSPMAESLKTLHKKEVYVIHHGFNLEDINVLPIDLTNKFTLTYTGQIYVGKQDPFKLLFALRDLIAEKIVDSSDIEVRLYGPKRDWLNKKIKIYKLPDIIKQYGVISRTESLKKQRESQALILLKWEDEKSKGVYTGKIFEYLVSKRPILATGGTDDVVTELLKETNAGIDAQTVEDIKRAIKEMYLEYKNNRKVVYRGDINKINKYSVRETVKKYADALNRIT